MQLVRRSNTWPIEGKASDADRCEQWAESQRPYCPGASREGNLSSVDVDMQDLHDEETMLLAASPRVSEASHRETRVNHVSFVNERPLSIGTESRKIDDHCNLDRQSEGSTPIFHNTHFDEQGSTNVVFEAIDPPSGYPCLDFRPTFLKPTVTIIICVFDLILAIGLTLLIILPGNNVTYSITTDIYYLAVRYGPGVLAAISSFFKNTVQEVLRMLPYINMADPRGPFNPRYTVLARYWPLLHDWNHSWGTFINFILPLLSQYLLGYKMLIFEVARVSTGWEVKIHTKLAIPLIIYYTFTASYMLGLTVWMWDRSTGIRSGWDPQSLADVMNLFAYFNEDLDDTTYDDLVFSGSTMLQVLEFIMVVR
ncbi:hypothetical protein F4808DRAFT_473951 [Astrocystis sublimbata]|nr:hypothetical protein F4808DRAFT_473951 [Astrocystis sublimbata]